MPTTTLVPDAKYSSLPTPQNFGAPLRTPKLRKLEERKKLKRKTSLQQPTAEAKP